MLTVLRRWAVLTGALALTFVVEGPALAGTYNHTDARHDVKRYPQMQRAPHNRQADVTHLRIVHNDKAVRFYVRFRSGSMTHETDHYRLETCSVQTAHCIVAVPDLGSGPNTGPGNGLSFRIPTGDYWFPYPHG
jgi:hypothetical protein